MDVVEEAEAGVVGSRFQFDDETSKASGEPFSGATIIVHACHVEVVRPSTV